VARRQVEMLLAQLPGLERQLDEGIRAGADADPQTTHSVAIPRREAVDQLSMAKR
jgi:hypothetical protein